jgi:O-antigen/teichoic acid export membrane protein
MKNTAQEFEKSSFLLFAFSMVVNICNYIYQIVMGHLLTVSNYGTLNTLLSITIIAAVPASGMLIIGGKYIADFSVKNDMTAISNLTKWLLRIGLMMGGLLALIGLIFSKTISARLNIVLSNLVVAAIAVSAISYLIPALQGILLGKKRFSSFSIMNIIVAAGKLILGTILVILGCGLYGNIFGLLAGTVFAILFGLYSIRDLFQPRSEDKKLSIELSTKSYFSAAFGIQIITALLTNGDILLIKAFVKDTEYIGVYSSGMVIGKIALYVSSAVVTALLPIVAERSALRQDTRKLFAKAMLYGGGAAFICAAGIVTFGNSIITILFGSRYSGAIGMLFPISCFVIPLACLTIQINYLAAIGKTKVLVTTLSICLALIIILIRLYHDSIEQILFVMGSVLLLEYLINLPSILKTDPSKEYMR